MKTKLVTGTVLTVLLIAGIALAEPFKRSFLNPTDSTITDSTRDPNGNQIVTAAQDLSVPWGLAELPGGDLLVTERGGTLRRIGQDKQSHIIEGVEQTSEGGLLGLALHPNFADNKFVYVYLTTKTGETLTNRIERYQYTGSALIKKQLLLGNIPGEQTHDGGRIAFGPDKYLYVTVGDAGNSALAQDKNALAGKILRLTDAGQPAPGNPFNNAVYSYGHRNPQGLAWDSNGQLWETEHGRSGPGTTGYDELNLIKAGANYGWPDIQGDETSTGMQKPVAHSGPDETWAPGGLAYSQGSLYFGGLRGQTLYQAKIDSYNTVKLTAHFREDYGRLRTTYASGDTLYLTTSNTDGRGEPKAGDDRILKFTLSAID